MCAIAISQVMPVMAWQSQSPQRFVEHKVSVHNEVPDKSGRKVVTNVSGINRVNTPSNVADNIAAAEAADETATVTVALVYDPDKYGFLNAMIKNTDGENTMDFYHEENGKVVIEHAPGIFDMEGVSKF